MYAFGTREHYERARIGIGAPSFDERKTIIDQIDVLNIDLDMLTTVLERTCKDCRVAITDANKDLKDMALNMFVCTENQALTTATGLYVGGGKPVVAIQNQGMLNCINTLRATCIDASVPMVFFVGQHGREAENFGQPARQSRRSMVRFTEPLLDSLNIRYWNVDEDADIAKVNAAFAHADTAKTAAVVLIGRHVTWN